MCESGHETVRGRGGRTDGWMHAGWMDGCKDDWMDGCMDAWMVGWMNGRMDGWGTAWMDGRLQKTKEVGLFALFQDV